MSKLCRECEAQGWVGIGIGDDSVSTVPPKSDFRDRPLGSIMI